MSTENLFSESLDLFFNYDYNFIEIVIISLKISLSATIIASLISIPLASLLSVKSFTGKYLLIIFTNTLTALPPVVVGLFLYIIFSNQGIFGLYDLLYTIQIMIIAQTILITPVLITLTKETIDKCYSEYKDYLLSLRINNRKIMYTLIWESRYSLITNILVGLGRGLSEVGAIIIVGGNIAHLTRTMTTGIVLETSKGDLSLAISLGIALLAIAFFINVIIFVIKYMGENKYNL